MVFRLSGKCVHDVVWVSWASLVVTQLDEKKKKKKKKHSEAELAGLCCFFFFSFGQFSWSWDRRDTFMVWSDYSNECRLIL